MTSALFIGLFAALLVLTLTAAGCLFALQRKRNNRKCIGGLLVISLTCICAVIASLSFQRKDGWGGLPLISYLAVLVGAFSALGVSSVGLRELALRKRRRRSRRASRGRRRGWVAVILSSAIIVLSFTGLYRAVVPASTEASTPLASKPFSGKTIMMPRLNFRFTAPREWTPIDSSKLNYRTTAAFARTNPRIVFDIVAENPGPHAPRNLTALAEQARSHLRDSALTASFEDERHLSQQGLDVIRFAATADFDDDPLFYAFWIAQQEGRCYQLICWGPQAARETIEREAEELFPHFELLRVKNGGQP